MMMLLVMFWMKVPSPVGVGALSTLGSLLGTGASGVSLVSGG